ncbi:MULTISPECIES: ActS/PrrB/RegB family redox-sensitive histidine kinase [Alphaproteobacteria]|uniref:histidine kinase n=2 Tax=Alphaproteobacteria TaxID=28211 RepID=A0A512HM52_9HYPH|nr:MULTISPECIES: ActS/PrrB/RegB family redox-sensitive histidine kinase [Alphaproteobacteria]GEO86542.1 two-component sensor histidine kinase [Ciceribacter naphthalenivorans]GLR20886.1 two-component sensor histidine kinase [Ciceribacter naphthalenivorans]GLT03742.1 two-component sensor histidine kinase [Sphingomonas psychrolutea]
MTTPDTALQFGPSSRRLRLQTLVWLRWLAVAGQGTTVLVVAFALHFPLPLLACAVLIGALAAANFLLSVRFPSTYRLEPLAAFAVLALDLFQLGALLFITGGLANPFVPLICVPVIISFASQPLRHAMALFALAMLLISALPLSPYPLPWYQGGAPTLQPVMQVGVWFAITSMMAFAAFYAYRVSQEAALLADALSATELVLQKEKHLSQLDGLAAAAAHELGTPLATISLVAKEMERELGQDERFGEDVQLLRSQSERCRDILKRIATLPSESEEHMRRLPLSSLIEDVLAPHREFGIKIDLIEKSDRSQEPVGIRNAGILYGLGNLIENAVDFAREKVTVTVEHDASKVSIMIEDDGEGYSPDVLQRIGEPYVTNRQRDDKAGGLGLGLFIAKTLLERSGARLRFENRAPDQPGARVEVVWPRHRMEA